MVSQFDTVRNNVAYVQTPSPQEKSERGGGPLHRLEQRRFRGEKSPIKGASLQAWFLKSR